MLPKNLSRTKTRETRKHDAAKKGQQEEAQGSLKVIFSASLSHWCFVEQEQGSDITFELSK